MNGALLWGGIARGAKLPPAMLHWRLILAVTQVFTAARRKSEKLQDAREQKRIREVAELVRKREAGRKRRS